LYVVKLLHVLECHFVLLMAIFVIASRNCLLNWKATDLLPKCTKLYIIFKKLFVGNVTDIPLRSSSLRVLSPGKGQQTKERKIWDMMYPPSFMIFCLHNY